jgi:hypothetical protein
LTLDDRAWMNSGCMFCRQHALDTVSESIRRLQAKFGSVPLLNPKTDLKVTASAHRKLQGKLDHLDSMLDQTPLYAECVLAISSWVCPSECSLWLAAFGIDTYLSVQADVLHQHGCIHMFDVQSGTMQRVLARAAEQAAPAAHCQGPAQGDCRR